MEILNIKNKGFHKAGEIHWNRLERSKYGRKNKNNETPPKLVQLYQHLLKNKLLLQTGIVKQLIKEFYCK